MDKILSARVDESVLTKISLLAQKLQTSKKKIIESAVQFYAQKMEGANRSDIFSQTHGVWKRKESAIELIKNAKSKFQKSMERHHS